MAQEYPYEKVCGCGLTILMVKDEKGTVIPIDRRAPIYREKVLDPEGRWERIPGGGVSHFATCPKASNYSKSKEGV